MLTLFSSVVIADEGDSNGQRNAQDSTTSMYKQGKNSLRLTANETVTERIKNAQEIRTKLQERKDNLKEQIKELKENKREIFEKRNEIKTAVHALMLIRDIDLKIGPRIAEIATEFNNSEERIQWAEEKIEERPRFAKFLFGANKEAIKDIKEITIKNRERIMELKKLRTEIKDEETKVLFDEQITELDAEQERLTNKIEKESRRGIFSFLTR